MNRHWSTNVAIGTFCDTGSGGTPDRSKGEFYGGDIPWVKSGELREDVIFETEEHLTEAGLKNSSAKLVPAGSLLVAMYGATVGRLAVLGCDAATNQAICNIRPDPAVADTRYLFRALEAKVPDLVRIASGGAQPNISQEKIRNTKVYLPPLDEQRRIAAILDKADALRRKRKRAITLLDSLTQSTFLEMFGHWTSRIGALESTVADACLKITDGTHHSPETRDSGVPYVTAKHLRPDGLDFFADPWFVTAEDHAAIYTRCNPELGDVLYIKDGATTGIAAVNPYEFPFSMLSSLALLKPDRSVCLPEYLAAWLNSAPVKAYMTGSMSGAGITRLTLAKIKGAKIALPPIEQQAQFTAQAKRALALRDRYGVGASELARAFASLQHLAFSGQL